MKLSTHISRIFAVLVVVLTLLTITAFASSQPAANPRSAQASNNYASPGTTARSIATNLTYDIAGGTLNRQNSYAHGQDSSALRSNRFSMPDPARYAIATSPGYGPVRRKAPIKRKGTFQG